MSYPSPTSFDDLFLSRSLVGSLPQIFVTDGVGPVDTEYLSKAVIDEGLDFVYGAHSGSPCFGSVQQN